MASRKRHQGVLICCIAILAVLILFEPSYGWRVRQWLTMRIGADASLAGSADLTAQNEALQAQIAEFQSIQSEIPNNPQHDVRAMVYAQYPFGFRNALLLNSGANNGVTTGSTITFDDIFIGTVSQVFATTASVETVFDPAFKMPVRIGAATSSFDGLLVGGAEPRITSISKDASLTVGDIVYTAAPKMPYGLPIGTVASIAISGDRLFQEASVNFAYDINQVQTVLIEP